MFHGYHLKPNKMEPLLQYVQDEFVPKKELPSFQAGDTITVYYEIREGSKVRTQFFKGVVIQIKGSGATKTFTIRKMSGTVGVERIFPRQPAWYSENRGKCTRKSTSLTYFLFP
jgi:large subunit ribosomal protein L19